MSTASAATAPLAADRIARDALLAPESYLAPSTVAQVQMARIWAAALRLDRVGLEDDFFELGGDSAAGVALCAEIERLMGRRVGPSLLLDAPTLASFTAEIERDMLDHAGRILVPARGSGERPPLVLVHGLDGSVFFVRRLAWLLSPELPVWGVQARGMDGLSPPHQRVRDMVIDYAHEIHRQFADRPIFLGGFCMGGVLAIDVLHHLVQLGGRAHRLIMIDPPPNPVQHRREISEAEQGVNRQFRSQKIVQRMQELAVGRDDIAEHYRPGGPGFENALRVSAALTQAYSHYNPRWTRMPVSILWSGDRAAMRRRRPSDYPLARGPTHAFIVRNRKTEVSHQLLMSEGIRPVAQIVDRIMHKHFAPAPATNEGGASPPSGTETSPASADPALAAKD